jgi:hypothetical protein
MSSGQLDVKRTWGTATEKRTARGCGFVIKNTAVGPPAAEFVKDRKPMETRGVADAVGNKAASAIVPSRTRTATPITRNRLVVFGILYKTPLKSDDASVLGDI